MKPFDFVKDIEYPKQNLMQQDPAVEKEYLPFIVNRALSYHFDCIMFANEINQRPLTDKRMQYDYLLGVIRARRRGYNKWEKNISPESIDTLKTIYGFSKRVALMHLPILSEHELSVLQEKADPGGLKKSK